MDFVSTVSSSTSVNGGNLCCPDCNEPLTLQLGSNDNSAASSTNNMQNSIWNESKRRRKSILDKIDLRNFQTSTKMEALMEELYRMGEEDVGSKAIVFSQFVNMLDVSGLTQIVSFHNRFSLSYMMFYLTFLVAGVSYSGWWNRLCEIVRLNDC